MHKNIMRILVILYIDFVMRIMVSYNHNRKATQPKRSREWLIQSAPVEKVDSFQGNYKLYITCTRQENRSEHMSSFTISKQEYIKAAGYIAGIASGSSIGVREFWIYDTIEHKNTDADLYYKRFCQCYEMNAKSVAEQYKDEKPEQDTNDYMKEFKSFYKKGYSLIAQDGETQRQAIANIQKFFHGSLYQVENEKYNFMMAHFYNKILDQLTDMILLNGYESDSWGTFEAPEGRNITRIA